MAAVPREKVTWVPPELVDPDPEVVKALAKAKEADAVAAVLATATSPRGEYRVVEDMEVISGPGGLQEVPVWGPVVQFVDMTPGDPTDNSGYFRVYDGSYGDYIPIISATALDDIDHDAVDGGPVDPEIITSVEEEKRRQGLA